MFYIYFVTSGSEREEAPLPFPSQESAEFYARSAFNNLRKSCIRADIFDPSTGKILKQVPNLFIERPDPPATETEI